MPAVCVSEVHPELDRENKEYLKIFLNESDSSSLEPSVEAVIQSSQQAEATPEDPALAAALTIPADPSHQQVQEKEAPAQAAQHLEQAEQTDQKQTGNVTPTSQPALAPAKAAAGDSATAPEATAETPNNQVDKQPLQQAGASQHEQDDQALAAAPAAETENNEKPDPPHNEQAEHTEQKQTGNMTPASPPAFDLAMAPASDSATAPEATAQTPNNQVDKQPLQQAEARHPEEDQALAAAPAAETENNEKPDPPHNEQAEHTEQKQTGNMTPASPPALDLAMAPASDSATAPEATAQTPNNQVDKQHLQLAEASQHEQDDQALAAAPAAETENNEKPDPPHDVKEREATPQAAQHLEQAEETEQEQQGNMTPASPPALDLATATAGVSATAPEATAPEATAPGATAQTPNNQVDKQHLQLAEASQHEQDDQALAAAPAAETENNEKPDPPHDVKEREATPQAAQHLEQAEETEQEQQGNMTPASPPALDLATATAGVSATTPEATAPEATAPEATAQTPNNQVDKQPLQQAEARHPEEDQALEAALAIAKHGNEKPDPPHDVKEREATPQAAQHLEQAEETEQEQPGNMTAASPPALDLATATASESATAPEATAETPNNQVDKQHLQQAGASQHEQDDQALAAAPAAETENNEKPDPPHNEQAEHTEQKQTGNMIPASPPALDPAMATASDSATAPEATAQTPNNQMDKQPLQQAEARHPEEDQALAAALAIAKHGNEKPDPPHDVKEREATPQAAQHLEQAEETEQEQPVNMTPASTASSEAQDHYLFQNLQNMIMMCPCEDNAMAAVSDPYGLCSDSPPPSQMQARSLCDSTPQSITVVRTHKKRAHKPEKLAPVELKRKIKEEPLSATSSQQSSIKRKRQEVLERNGQTAARVSPADTHLASSILDELNRSSGSSPESNNQDKQIVKCLMVSEKIFQTLSAAKGGYMIRSYNLQDLPATLHIVISQSSTNSTGGCIYAGTLEVDSSFQISLKRDLRKYTADPAEEAAWRSKMTDSKKAFAWHIRTVAAATKPHNIKFIGGKHRNRHFLCEKQQLLSGIDIALPKLSLYSTSSFFLKLLPNEPYNHLKLVAKALDGHNLRIATTCSGSDICITALEALVQTINEEFGVSRLQFPCRPDDHMPVIYSPTCIYIYIEFRL